MCQCGTRLEEWQADPDAYIGDFYECPGCARLEDERNNVPEGTQGVHYRLLPKDIALAKMEAQDNAPKPKEVSDVSP